MCCAWPGLGATWAKHAEVLFHSDWDSQYASSAFKDVLKEYGITSSMSWRGNCCERQCLQRDPVRLIEGRAFARLTLRDPASSGG